MKISLTEALFDPHSGRKILTFNKKFMVCFNPGSDNQIPGKFVIITGEYTEEVSFVHSWLGKAVEYEPDSDEIKDATNQILWAYNAYIDLVGISV